MKDQYTIEEMIEILKKRGVILDREEDLLFVFKTKEGKARVQIDGYIKVDVEASK